MKMKLAALLMIAVMPLMAFDCITDFSNVTVSLNLAPISAKFPLNQGSGKTFGGTSPSINIAALFDQDYTVTDATLYDITVKTEGTEDLGAGTGAVAITVNGVTTPLFSFSGTWTDYNTPRSLITYQNIVANPAGIIALRNAVTNTGHQTQTVTLSAAGTVQNAPTTTGVDAIVVSVYVQATGHR